MKEKKDAGLSEMEWVPHEDDVRLIRHLSIQNAIEYEGKAAIGSVIGRIMGIRPDLRQHGKNVTTYVAQAVQDANSMAIHQGVEALVEILTKEAPQLLEKRETQQRREGLPTLPGATKGEVVLRFAPNPNGPLSFGHARGLVINETYRAMYDGQLILRFDDTDTKVKPPLLDAYQDIEQEATWLIGRSPDRIIIASDRIEIYYQHAEEMLTKSFGYVCTCTGDEFKEFRTSMIPCPCRSISSEENLSRWNMMIDGTFQPGDAVVRVKTDMSLKNPALRDWPALRIQDTVTHPHPRPEIGSKYRVWPLLDFQSAVEDHLQGVTHIIRGKDLMDSTRKQSLLYEHFGWTYPQTQYWGRVKVHEWGGFSTSQMRNDIEAGVYSGWDDPRLPTLKGLQGRGIQAEALREFWLELGITQKDISVPLSTLYSHNTKSIDDKAKRLCFIRKPTLIEVNQMPQPKEVEILIHPNHPELGTRVFKIEPELWVEAEDEQNTELRLKEFADIQKTGQEWNFIAENRTHQGPIIHWLPHGFAEDAKLESTHQGERIIYEGKVEPNSIPIGSIVQLERIGYAIKINHSHFLLCHETTSDKEER